uniref:Uncharacterized protein n=1 Tax=Oryza brachyantha TaxID=4533 RepID=J3N6M7_ORYBR
FIFQVFSDQFDKLQKYLCLGQFFFLKKIKKYDLIRREIINTNYMISSALGLLMPAFPEDEQMIVLWILVCFGCNIYEAEDLESSGTA